MASVRLPSLTKQYAGVVTAVSGLSLDIADSKFVVLVGPSGGGKSTALKARRCSRSARDRCSKTVRPTLPASDNRRLYMTGTTSLYACTVLARGIAGR